MSDRSENQLDIAKQLFQQSSINGAAIIAGNALIDNMLSLGSRYNLPKTIVEHQPDEINAGDKLNQMLFELGAYNLDVCNQIKHWLSIRTEAAKNREDYTIKEVEQMINGIEKFGKEFLIE